MRSLIDGGAVVRDTRTGHWKSMPNIETITIPDTIQGVIMARVDRLDEELKQVLRSASVIGRAFLYRYSKGSTRLYRDSAYSSISWKTWS